MSKWWKKAHSCQSAWLFWLIGGKSYQLRRHGYKELPGLGWGFEKVEEKNSLWEWVRDVFPSTTLCST